MVRDIIILIAVFMVIPVDGSSDYISDYRNKCNELIMAGQSIEEDQRLWQLFDANWKYQMESSPESVLITRAMRRSSRASRLQPGCQRERTRCGVLGVPRRALSAARIPMRT